MLKKNQEEENESQVCHLCREPIEQVLKIDLKTVFKEYIRVIESAQVACKGKIVNYYEDRSNLELESSN